MISNGTTAVTTGGSDNAVPLIAAQSGGGQYFAGEGGAIINDAGSAAGFFSFDGFVTFGRLPAGPSSIPIPPGLTFASIQIKRVAGGPDVNSVWAFIF